MGFERPSLAYLDGVRGLERVEVERGVLRVDRELLPDVPDAAEHPECVNAPVHAWWCGLASWTPECDMLVIPYSLVPFEEQSAHEGWCSYQLGKRWSTA